MGFLQNRGVALHAFKPRFYGEALFSHRVAFTSWGTFFSFSRFFFFFCFTDVDGFLGSTRVIPG